MQPIRNRNLHLLLAGLAVLSLALVTAGPAAAQFTTGFEASEGYQAAADGSVIVSGQNGWYNPDPTASDDQMVFAYSGNALGLPQNPNGGDQFLGAMALGDGNFPRAQHDIDVSAGGIWTISFDMCVSHGTGHFKQNLSSFSLSDGAAGNTYLIALNIWQKNTLLTSGSIDWIPYMEIYDSTGVGPTPVKMPKAFRKKSQNNWYRQSITLDFNSNQVTAMSLTDLSTSETVTITPTTWYLFGGAGGTARPTAFRFFVGGGTGTDAGNIMGWDNISILPGGPAAVGGKVINLGDVECQPVDKPLGVTH